MKKCPYFQKTLVWFLDYLKLHFRKFLFSIVIQIHLLSYFFKKYHQKRSPLSNQFHPYFLLKKIRLTIELKSWE